MPEGIQELWRCSTEGHDLGGMMGMGWPLNLTILEVFSNLNGSMIPVNQQPGLKPSPEACSCCLLMASAVSDRLGHNAKCEHPASKPPSLLAQANNGFFFFLRIYSSIQICISLWCILYFGYSMNMGLSALRALLLSYFIPLYRLPATLCKHTPLLWLFLKQLLKTDVPICVSSPLHK